MQTTSTSTTCFDGTVISVYRASQFNRGPAHASTMRLVTFGGEGRHSFRFDGITGRQGRTRVCSTEHVTMARAVARHGGWLENARDAVEKKKIKKNDHCSRTIRSDARLRGGMFFIRMLNSMDVLNWILPAIYSTTEFRVWRSTWRRTRFKIVHKFQRNMQGFIYANEWTSAERRSTMHLCGYSRGWILTIQTSSKIFRF